MNALLKLNVFERVILICIVYLISREAVELMGFTNEELLTLSFISVDNLPSSMEQKESALEDSNGD